MASILVLDDQVNILTYVSQALRGLGHEVFATTNPTEAYNLVAEKKPDLVVLDFQMPGASGSEVFAELRRYHRIPVLFITAYARDQADATETQTQALEDAFNSGAVDILYKPFSVAALEEKIGALLGEEADEEDTGAR